MEPGNEAGEWERGWGVEPGNEAIGSGNWE